MGGNTIKDINELIAKVYIAVDTGDMEDASLLLKSLYDYLQENPQTTSLDLIKALDALEEKIKGKQKKIIEDIQSLQNLKKYRS